MRFQIIILSLRFLGTELEADDIAAVPRQFLSLQHQQTLKESRGFVFCCNSRPSTVAAERQEAEIWGEGRRGGKESEGVKWDGKRRMKVGTRKRGGGRGAVRE
ncbi:hypothetical protein PoB_006514500 [Plakobranchus ocellatus]|uniref:Secreted protein n=1 Tax=Plakobranchus ocellatus TaxID=259542 RepID=A0AAV4D3T4_9GAST|nr:hypothetical protein PoB_006514500 [Plakobranchus ocellatus]